MKREIKKIRIYFNNFFENIEDPVLFNIRFREPPQDTLIISEAKNLLSDFAEIEVFHFALICKHLNDMKKNLSPEEFDIVFPTIMELGLRGKSFSQLDSVINLSKAIILQYNLEQDLSLKTTHKASQKL